MRVLVIGAAGTLGRSTLVELARRGHQVIGLTRSSSTQRRLFGLGHDAELGDVLNPIATTAALARSEPDAVLALLSARPPRAPIRVRQFRPTVALWEVGAANLLEACVLTRVKRVVAASSIFAYGYGDFGTEPIDEASGTHQGALLRGHHRVLKALRGMERLVLESEQSSGPEGMVLRFGALYGTDVPSTQYLLDALRRGKRVLPGDGRGVLPYVELGDAARGAVDALERGRSGEIYNLVDDRPCSFAEYATALSASIAAPQPRSLPLWLARVMAPHAVSYLVRTQLPVSNAKAKRELGWEPHFPDVQEWARGTLTGGGPSARIQ
jgi:nucleoside-diphosphate-sugar epimerase